MNQKIRRILVVDDEEAILFSYQKLFRGALVDVDTCRDVEAAFELVKARHYDAIVTDLQFAHSDDQGGLELLRYLRRHRAAIPVILMTGYGNDEVQEKVRALGVAAYFDKPVPVSAILASLKELGIPVGAS
jgi:CheY-like chemotaxis protein